MTAVSGTWLIQNKMTAYYLLHIERKFMGYGKDKYTIFSCQEESGNFEVDLLEEVEYNYSLKVFHSSTLKYEKYFHELWLEWRRL